MSQGATVYVVYREDGLEPATRTALYWEGAPVQYRLTSVRDHYAYADTVRMLWPATHDWVICEQDVVPPRGSIAYLLSCPEPWCTHRAWTGHRYHDDTLQLAKITAQLRARHPQLADTALAAERPANWVRKGLTYLDPNCNEATMRKYGRRACLRPDASGAALLTQGGRPVSTVDWITVDSHLARELRALGYEPHVHEPPPEHLHDYQRRPVNVLE